MHLWLPVLLACAGDPVGDSTATSRSTTTLPTGATTGTPTGSTPTTTGTTTLPEPDPTLELGSQAIAHEPLLEGDPLPLVFGGQGGFHVEVSGRTTLLGPAVLVDAWAVRVDDGSELARIEAPTAVNLAEYDEAVDSGWFAGQRALLADNSLVHVCALHGATIRLCATATSLDDPGMPVEACFEGPALMAPAQLDYCGSP